MDENKVETKVSGNSMGLIAVMVIIGVVAVAGFVFMNSKKAEVVVVPAVSQVVDESGIPEAVKNADDLTMPTQSDVVTFDVKGGDFKFMPATITVKKGQTVKINFESTMGFHDFVIDELSVATEKLNTGGKTTVEFVASKVGSFEYYCSVGEHRANGMVGTIIVTE